MIRLVVVTGAASGIRQEIMAALLKQGDNLFGIDRLSASGIVSIDLGQPDADDQDSPLSRGATPTVR